jgi:hypothetical protein
MIPSILRPPPDVCVATLRTNVHCEKPFGKEEVAKKVRSRLSHDPFFALFRIQSGELEKLIVWYSG